MPLPSRRSPQALRAPSNGRLAITVGVLASALVVAVAVGISIGTVSVPVGTVWQVLGTHLGWSDAATNPVTDQIVWEFRTPRVLLAAVVGAGLSVSGACLQVVARNSLADPYVLGVSSGAALGAVLVMAYGSTIAGGLGASGAAFAGSLLTLLAVVALAHRNGRVGPTRLVLAGVAVSYLTTAMTSFVQLYVDPNALRGIMFWLLGSLASATWADLRVPTLGIVVATIWLLTRARAMNALTVGDDTASALGIDVSRVRIELLVVSSLLTGAAVSVSGGIGFVGLMVPHAARFVVGSDHRRVLPVVTLGGATFMVLVDVLSRTVDKPNELPVGVFTAAIGAPFFIILLRRHGRTQA
jgi:iron complex transport system permease protein